MNREPATKAAFVTFYSFKGGVGRSMALINTAGILAGQRGFRVLVLDLDLEAPGLSYLNPEAPDAATSERQAELTLQPGFVELLTDAKERGPEADLFKLDGVQLEAKYMRKIKIPDHLRDFPDGSLHIMPAGRFDSDYARRLDALDLNSLYRQGLGEPLIRSFKKNLVESGRYDYVLVDSRTGISEGAGICTRDLADLVMILSGLNRQNVEGTSEFLREFRAATDGKKSFRVVLSPMPNGEDKLVEERRKVAEGKFEAAWGAKVDLSLEIPYHPQLALTEEPHIFRSRRGYLFEAYRAIEQQMIEALGHGGSDLMTALEGRLDKEKYVDASDDLRRIARLPGGGEALFRLAIRLATDEPQSVRSQPGDEPTRKRIDIRKILADKNGRVFLESLVDDLPLGVGAWPVRSLLSRFEDLDDGLAERLYKRLVEAQSTHPGILGNYALFLEKQNRPDEAETFYKRALEVDPTHAPVLRNYAVFLGNRNRIDEAEAFYKRALEADPKDASNLGNYALFLTKRNRTDEAEAFYKRALEADPIHVGILGNYGQFLVGVGRFQDGADTLFQAIRYADPSEPAGAAEFCFALWLANRILGHEEKEWEGRFKFLIERGFTRHKWSFETMLKQAANRLSPDELEYAKALALAFLDETKVPELAKFPRWRALEPLNPWPQQSIS